jgi:hypothetical protein
MADSFDSPEAATRGETPARFARIIAVEYSPSGERALVFAEFNETPHTELYEMLCEKEGGRWHASTGGSGGGRGWKWTHDDPVRGPLGVASRWNPPAARWEVPSNEGA